MDKSEYRNQKSETSPKFKFSNVPNSVRTWLEGQIVLNFEFLSFEIVSNFVLRISNLISVRACRKGIKFSVALIGLMFFLLSCKDEPTTPSLTPAEPIARVSKQKVTKDISAESQKIQKNKDKKADTFTYIASGRRDPFRPFLVVETSLEVKKSKPKTPLQEYNINELKLVAIIWGMGKPTAMVEDRAGKGYIIKKGTLIGDKDGRVVKISKDQVVVRERFKNLLGDIQESKVLLELPKLEEEGFK